MIKIINKNNDLVVELNITDDEYNAIHVDDVADCTVTVYTTQTPAEKRIIIGKDKIQDNQIFILNEELSRLEEGILFFDIHIRYTDSRFDDGYFDYETTVQNNIYIR